MIELLAPSRQQPEVTPVVPFKNKIQCYQLKQSFLITLYYTTIFFCLALEASGYSAFTRKFSFLCRMSPNILLLRILRYNVEKKLCATRALNVCAVLE
jgi:hypothetical protein